MRIVAKPIVTEFINKHPNSERSLKEWYLKTKSREWKNLHDIKETFNSVDYVEDDLYVFNISGNKYRLIARIFFEKPKVYIKLIGTHAEYSKIDLNNL